MNMWVCVGLGESPECFFNKGRYKHLLAHQSRLKIAKIHVWFAEKFITNWIHIFEWALQLDFGMCS